MIERRGTWLEKGDVLVCFGDSFTAEVNGYVPILTEALGPRGIQVIAAGLCGDKTPTALTRYQRDVLDRKPSAVLIYLGTNDARVGRGKWADEPVVTPDAYRCNLEWMVHMGRQNGIRKFSIAPPLHRLEGDEWKENGEIYSAYCLAARRAAEEVDAWFVPVDTAAAEEWQRHPGHAGLLVTCDGLHPTPAGYRMVAETMLKAWGMQ